MENDHRQVERHLLRVAAILKLADSKKITDRRTFIEDLQNIYTNNEFIKAINIESTKGLKNPTSWNEIMLTVHRVAISEAERPLGRSAKGNSTAQLGCSALMRKTVRLATSTLDMSLNCNDLMASVFQVLCKKTYIIYHDTYVDILANHVLGNKMYWLKFTAEQWRETLRISIKLYRKNSNVSKRVLMDIMRLVVELGCLQSHLVLDVKKILPFLEEIYQDVNADREAMLKPLYKLTYAVCQQIGTESRIALCEFSEKILPSIVSLEGSPEKMSLILLLVQIHHPGGVSLDDDAAYVRDRNLWKNIIAGIHGNIIRDIKAENLTPCFWKLSCEVYRQIIQDPTYLTETSSSRTDIADEQPRKRRRLLMTIQKPCDLLMDNDLQVTEPFIRILAEMLKKYPNSLKSSDYPAFLKTVTEFVASSLKNELIMDSLCKLCTVIIKIEKEHFHEAKQTESVRLCWEKICDIILRILSTNQNEVLGHELLQSIIEYKNVLDRKEFLHVYLKTQMHWTPSSVRTLLKFCTNVPIPNECLEPGGSTIRSSLIRWALKVPRVSKMIPVDSLANLLTALALKFSYKREFREFQNCQDRVSRQKIAAAESLENDLFNDRESKASSDIERCNLALEFRQDLFELPEESTQVDANMSTVIVRKVFDLLIVTLIEFLANPLNEKNVSVFIGKAGVVAKLMSNFLELDVEFDSLMSSLFDAFGEAYKNILTQLMLMENSSCSYLVQAFEALETFYRTQNHCKVAEIIVNLTTIDFIGHIYNFVPDDNEDTENEENCQQINVRDLRANTNTYRLSDACRVRNSAHKILTYFCCPRIGEEIAEIQIRVLKNLMKIDIYQCRNDTDLRKALNVLKIFGESKCSVTNEESLNITTVFLENLFKARPSDEIVVRGILNVLPYFVKSVNFDSDDSDPLLNILSQIYGLLVKEQYGPLVHADFVKCLTKLISVNPFLKCKIVGTGETTSIVEIVTRYINNPFYVVRLEVVRALYAVFSNNLDIPWKVKFFGKVASAIGKLFVIEDLTDACEKADEVTTRTVTAVQILVAIIRSNEFLHGRALHAMIQLSVTNTVETKIIKKALLSVTKNETELRRLLEINLHDLLSRWLKAENSLEKFPWTLVNCDSQEDFSKKYINIVLMIKLQRLEFREFEILCTNLNVSFSQTIEQYFPCVMSLLMAMIVQESSSPEVQAYARKMLERLRRNAGEFAKVEKFHVLLQEKLPEVMVNIIERLNDREHLFKMLDINIFLPKANSSNFNADTVAQCLRRLLKDLSMEKLSLIEYLVTRRPSVLQKILLKLFCNVCNAKKTDGKILAFHQYAYFYIMVLQDISCPYFDPMSLYVVRDLSHSLLAFMEEENVISKMACVYFQIFLRNVLPARANEIKEILSFAVSRLIPIIQGSKGEVHGLDVVKCAIEVLRYLIIDNREFLGEAIGKLDSFPNNTISRSLQSMKQVHESLKYSGNRTYSLEEEIEHFLNAPRDKTLGCSIESLSYIQSQLSTRKNELNELYRKLERQKDFPEDSASSTLHKLVYKLVQFTRSSRTEISLAAAKCLGELGPADLTTMILNTESGYTKEHNGEVEMLTFKVISLLADNLVDNNMNLRRTSADALYAVFSTSWGSKFMEKTILQDFIRLYEPKNSTLYECIYPFGTVTRKNPQTLGIDEKNWEICVNQLNDLWNPSNCDSYSQWIMEITCRCLDCFVNLYTEAVKPVCRLSVEFCEMLLPRLLNLVAKTQKSLVNDVCICVNRFFVHLFELIPSEAVTNAPGKKDVALSYECVRCMLNVVDFMRIQSNEYTPLAFDYLFVAKAAQYCSAYCTSVLYAELWCESFLRDSEMLQKKRPGGWTSPIDYICESNPGKGKLLQEIVREAYVHIGDADSIYGCGLSYLANTSFKTQHYVHLRLWNKVTLAHDVALSCGKNATRGMLNALQQSGHQYLLKCLINKVNKKTENVDDFMYETAWRLGDWNILEPLHINDTGNLPSYKSFDYHAAHYRALQSLRDDDVFGLKVALENARTSIVQQLRNTSLECSQTLYPILSRLQMLQEIEQFATEKPNNCSQLLIELDKQNFTDTHDFQYVEPILSQRLAIYQMQNAGNVASTELALTNTHLKIAEIAETQGYLPIAYRVLGMLAKKINLSDAARDQLTYRKALLDWKEKDHYMGRLVLRNLLKKTSLDVNLRVKALRIYGNWMAETTSESSQDIIEKYYKMSIAVSSNTCDLKDLTDAQADLAQFADAQYQQIVEFTKTPQYESLVECYKLKNDVTNRKDLAPASKDLSRAIVQYQRQVINDAAELDEINADKKNYLHLAVRYYLITLATGNNHDLLVYRMVSLWLDNMFNDDLNKIIKAFLPRVASYKFVTLLPQLATHMSNVLKHFTVNVNGLMERCAMEHPHHTLPLLLALKNTYKDHEFKPPTTVSQIHQKTRPEPRVIAVDVLISKLTKPNIRPIIQEMYQLSNALISLAYYKVPETEAKKLGGSHSIPRNQAITKIRNLNHTVVSTVTLDLRPSGNYENIVGIGAYEDTFELLGGVNSPKKIVCIDSTGVRRSQLLKGQYDLRRDAVVQQVCSAMNSMLKATKETKKRNLAIRTYNIVPLSRRSGVLEWCQNAQPISKILCDNGTIPGMHTKYYPNDWSVAKCRSKLRNVHKSSFDVKLKTFLECCKNMHPAFHHYFMEKYPSAETWFGKRLAYVRSVATTSMIGYMLGLGDRSCKNILIDQVTAEVIHVDFGVAFSEGKVSLTPETVPFRLTRDMEVAMGICGTEGVMKRCCEQTVTVLRERRKTLITLLQVLLYDPLFKWTLIPVEMDDHQGPSNRSSPGFSEDRDEKKTNKVAERALLKIEQKLEGMEDGLASSISGQVERLIQEARDPKNLCRMFYDWQPYL